MRKKQPKIFEPGYAGELTPDETNQIQKALLKSPAMRRKWGVSGKRRTAIARVASNGAQNG